MSLMIWQCIFVAIERQISTRSSREELIKRGILKDVDVDEGCESPANTGLVGDDSTILGEEFLCAFKL